MTAETYDDLKQCVGSKNSFTDDLLNQGYTKGKKDGYNQALDDLLKVCGGGTYESDCELCTFAIFKDDIRVGCELSKRINIVRKI